jgi:hypothetical protein
VEEGEGGRWKRWKVEVREGNSLLSRSLSHHITTPVSVVIFFFFSHIPHLIIIVRFVDNADETIGCCPSNG